MSEMKYGGIWINITKNEVNVDKTFVHNIMQKMINHNENHQSKSIKDYRQSENLSKW